LVPAQALTLTPAPARTGNIDSGSCSALKSKPRPESTPELSDHLWSVSEVFGWSRIPNNTWSRSRIFLSDSGSSSGSFFYITLLSCEFLLKWYNFFWNFPETENSCCVQQFPLSASCYKIVDSQISFTLCWGVGVGNFGKVGIEHLPSTPQPKTLRTPV